ncbi:hypothetical protein ACSBR1_035828 [Camellia fascicularis]
MPHIDRFDGYGDPMVHLRLFSDILRPMGLTRVQKLSLFGRTMSGIAINKLKKIFKKAQGVNSILDIEDGYTKSAVTLPEQFKMPRIDHFDGYRDPMVHLRLFSDILRPMGLTRVQKLSLFGRTMSGIAIIWYAKLEDSVK